MFYHSHKLFFGRCEICFCGRDKVVGGREKFFGGREKIGGGRELLLPLDNVKFLTAL